MENKINKYDVIIIGAGICGCALAYELSQYNISVLLLEKENDIALGATKANSGIVHAGYDPQTGSLMAKFNVAGSRLIENLVSELGVSYKKTGSLVIAFSPEENETLKKLYERGIANGVTDLSLLTTEETLELEPNLNKKITGSLLAKSAAVICPWEFALALAEVSVINGVTFKRNSEVKSIDKTENIFSVHVDNMGENVEYYSNYIVNCAGVYSDKIQQMVAKKTFSITPSRGEYYLLDHTQKDLVSHIIFQCPTPLGKGVLIAPTSYDNIIIGPNSENCGLDENQTTLSGLDYVKKASTKTIPTISFRDNIRNFAGIRANSDKNDFVFGEEPNVKGFVNIAGIKSPGLSSAPAIALSAVNLLSEIGLNLLKKEDAVTQRHVIALNGLSTKERQELIAKNPLYGRIICRCETITEGEIVACLHSPIPPISLDGVKRRCGSGLGRCQGGFCSPKVHEIIARELGVPMVDVLLDKEGSFILTNETKGGV